MAEYSGKRNAEPLGIYQKNIGTAAAQRLLQSFMEYRADTCRELYTSRISDVPGLHYTLVLNGKTKTIGNANFGPLFLLHLSQDMDALGKVDATWKKIGDMPAED